MGGTEAGIDTNTMQFIQLCRNLITPLKKQRKLILMKILPIFALLNSHIYVCITCRQQIEFLQKERPELRNTTDWKHLYTSLRRRWARNTNLNISELLLTKSRIKICITNEFHPRFGIPEEGFAETLFLCRKCRCLYWRSLGHPCLALKTDSGKAFKHACQK